MIWYLLFTGVAPTLFMKIEKNTVLILAKNTLIESMYGLNVLFEIQFLQHLGENNPKIFLCRVFWSVADKMLIKVPSIEEISHTLKIPDCVPVYSDSTNISFHLCDVNFCSGWQVYWFGINFSFFVGNTFLGVFMTAQFQCCVPVYSDSTNISFHLCDVNFCSGWQVYWFGINFSFFVGNTFLGVFMTAQFQCHLYQVSLGIQTVSALFQTRVNRSVNFFLNVFEAKRNV